MDCQGPIVDYPPLPLGTGSIHHLVTDRGTQSFNGASSPGAMGWMTRTSNLSQRTISRSPSLCSIPSSSTQDFLSTPSSESCLLQVPLVSSIRHRTPQACDKCRERKTKCSGHRPICVRCNNRGLLCKYSTRETRIRASMKLLGSSPSENGRSMHQDCLDAYQFEYGHPTPAHHSRMGYCQTRAFLGPGDYGQAVQTLPVKRISPITESHNLDEDLFAWHQYPAALPDPSSDRVAVSFRLPVSDAAIITEDERTLQKPAHVRLPPTDRYHEIPNHIRDQMARNPPVMDQEIGYNYSDNNYQVHPSASFSARSDVEWGLGYNTFNAREPAFLSGPKPNLISSSPIDLPVPATANCDAHDFEWNLSSSFLVEDRSSVLPSTSSSRVQCLGEVHKEDGLGMVNGFEFFHS